MIFKFAYTDIFYRAIRDTLHAEVDSWKHVTSPSEIHGLEQLWQRVDALEPISRNADATELIHVGGASHCESESRSQLIPLPGLLTSVGEA